MLDNYNASKYQNVMIVSHPDDETLWGGVNLYKDKYFVVCLTNGFNLKRANDYRQLLKFTKNDGIIYPYFNGTLFTRLITSVNNLHYCKKKTYTIGMFNYNYLY